MNLTVDIGNTRIKFGVFKAGVLTQTGTCDDISELRNNSAQYPIRQVIVSSVRKLSSTDTKTVEEIAPMTILDYTTLLPVQLEYQTVETLGPDRIAAVTGAHQILPDQNCLVIDAGTCITLDYITSDGLYLGGHIAPGIKMRLDAMHHFTASLPSLEAITDVDVIGKSTVDCMYSGAQNGAAFEIGGFIDWYEQKFGHIHVVITGGDAVFFAKEMKREIFVHSHLVLVGLDAIITHNDSTTD